MGTVILRTLVATSLSIARWARPRAPAAGPLGQECAMSSKDKLKEAGDTASEAATEAGHKVSEGAEKAGDWAKEKAHELGHRADEAAQKASHKADEMKGDCDGDECGRP